MMSDKCRKKRLSVGYNTLQQIAKKANACVLVIQGTGYDGYYQNGRIYINVNSDKPIITTMKHELTHHLESSNEYDALMSMVMDIYDVFCEQGVQATITDIIHEYKNYGIDLSKTEGQHELLARFVEEKMFTDEASIKKLYQEQPNLFKRISEWIKDSIKYVKSNCEQRALMDMEKLYIKAMQNTSTNQNQNIIYSIQSDEKGDYVDATQSVKGLYVKGDKKGNIARVKAFLNSLEGMSYTVNQNGESILIDKQTGNRWVYGKATNSGFNAKLSAAEFIDEIIKIAQNKGSSPIQSKNSNSLTIDWKTKNAKEGMDYYQVRFKVLNNDGSSDMYNAILNVGKNQNVNTLYEITNIRKENASLVQTQNQNSNGPIRANEALPIISISNNSENVKTTDM